MKETYYATNKVMLLTITLVTKLYALSNPYS